MQLTLAENGVSKPRETLPSRSSVNRRAENLDLGRCKAYTRSSFSCIFLIFSFKLICLYMYVNMIMWEKNQIPVNVSPEPASLYLKTPSNGDLIKIKLCVGSPKHNATYVLRKLMHQKVKARHKMFILMYLISLWSLLEF